MIRSSEPVKIPDIRAFFKIIADTNFKTEILDMSGKFRKYGNPNLRSVWLNKQVPFERCNVSPATQHTAPTSPCSWFAKGRALPANERSGQKTHAALWTFVLVPLAELCCLSSRFPCLQAPAPAPQPALASQSTPAKSKTTYNCF